MVLFLFKMETILNVVRVLTWREFYWLVARIMLSWILESKGKDNFYSNYACISFMQKTILILSSQGLNESILPTFVYLFDQLKYYGTINVFAPVALLKYT